MRVEYESLGSLVVSFLLIGTALGIGSFPHRTGRAFAD